MSNENPESPYSHGGRNPLYQEPEFPDFELQALLPGMVFSGKYRLMETAQRGGRGEVWKALDTVLNQEVALKFLPQALRRDETAINAMRTAVQSVRQLAHPAICPVYALEQDDRFGCYTVMKWLDGFTLREFLDEQRKFRMPLSLEVVRDILRRVAETLDFIHSHSVVHGNIHPQKIFLNLDNGRPQELFLMDFGSRTESGLSYLAPEIRHGAPSGAKSDQYSLAVMAYELLSGRHPFPQDRVHRWLNSGPEPFQPESFSAGNALGEAERNAVQNALMLAFSDSSVRYPSCVAFMDAVEQALDSKPEIVEVMPEIPMMAESGGVSEVIPSVSQSVMSPVTPPPVYTQPSVVPQEPKPFRFSPITPSVTSSVVTPLPVNPPVTPSPVTPTSVMPT
ncbi:MAG: serine/threonine-protein kinase, partial [Planctomycetia bacterium]|nr:serine/threonine-protein kinase [Planctomycetia bacterium]